MTSSSLELNKVEQGCEALLDILKDDRISQEKKLLGTPAPVFLQIDFVKIPKIRRRVVRMPLKNNILTDESDVCLIVADLIRGRKVNHEVTLNHYKKRLEKKGVLEAQKLHVMSSRQIRVDYATFEAKRKLCKMFDCFLIDNKISEYLRPKLGKEFPKARKWPIPIRMKRKNLKDEILSKLMKTSLALDGSGNSKTVQIGHVNMTPVEIAENIIKVSEYIASHFPGGWDNIRTFHIKGLRSMALPIYMSLISKNNVPKPAIKAVKRKQRVLGSGEVSIVGRKITVYRSGRLKIQKASPQTIEEKRIDDEIIAEAKKQKFEADAKEKKKITSENDDDTSINSEANKKAGAKKRKLDGHMKEEKIKISKKHINNENKSINNKNNERADAKKQKSDVTKKNKVEISNDGGDDKNVSINLKKNKRVEAKKRKLNDETKEEQMKIVNNKNDRKMSMDYEKNEKIEAKKQKSEGVKKKKMEIPNEAQVKKQKSDDAKRKKMKISNEDGDDKNVSIKRKKIKSHIKNMEKPKTTVQNKDTTTTKTKKTDKKGDSSEPKKRSNEKSELELPKKKIIKSIKDKKSVARKSQSNVLQRKQKMKKA